MAGRRPVQPTGGGGASAGAEAGPDRQTEGGGGAAERLPGDGARPHRSGTAVQSHSAVTAQGLTDAIRTICSSE